MSVVYFIQAGGGGLVKIGCSKHPIKRMSALQAWSPVPLVLIGQVPGDMADELHVHDRFQEERKHSEWFLPTRRLLSFVEEACRTGKLPDKAEVEPLDYEGASPFQIVSTLGELLKRHGVKGKDLAEELGVSPCTVSMWRQYGISARSYKRLHAFFAARGIAISPGDVYRHRKPHRSFAEQAASHTPDRGIA